MLFYHLRKENILNNKPKHNILKKALTTVGALIAATALTTSALAISWGAPNDNSIIFGKEYSGVKAYGWGDWEAHLSWRINLYVSTLADGSASPESGSIQTESGLKRIGSIIYTNETSEGRNVLLQVEYTDKHRYLTPTCTTATAHNPYKKRLCKLHFSAYAVLFLVIIASEKFF